MSTGFSFDLSNKFAMDIRILILCLFLTIAAGAQYPNNEIQGCLTEAKRSFDTKRPDYGQAWCQKALALAEKVYGKNDEKLVPTLDQIFTLYDSNELPKQAEQVRVRVLALKSRGRPAGDPVIAHERARLANYYLTQGRYKECNAQFEQAIAALLKDGHKPLELAQIYAEYADALKLQGKKTEAERMSALANRYRNAKL